MTVNLVTNPSFELGLTHWRIGQTAGKTQSDQVSPGLAPGMGVSSAQITVLALGGADLADYVIMVATFNIGAGIGAASPDPAMPLTVAATIQGPPGRSIAIRAVALSGTTSRYSKSTGDVKTVVTATGAPQRVSVVLPYDPMFPLDGFQLRAGLSTAGLQVGDVCLVDGVIAVSGVQAPDYFDGDTPGYQWDGAPNASTSSSRPRPAVAPPTRALIAPHQTRVAVPARQTKAVIG